MLCEHGLTTRLFTMLVIFMMLVDCIVVGYYMDYHSGGYSSYSCLLNLLPEVKVGVWSCVNAEGPREALNQYMMDLALGRWQQNKIKQTNSCGNIFPILCSTG